MIKVYGAPIDDAAAVGNIVEYLAATYWVCCARCPLARASPVPRNGMPQNCFVAASMTMKSAKT
jgi:hypothetical protein